MSCHYSIDRNFQCHSCGLKCFASCANSAVPVALSGIRGVSCAKTLHVGCTRFYSSICFVCDVSQISLLLSINLIPPSRPLVTFALEINCGASPSACRYIAKIYVLSLAKFILALISAYNAFLYPLSSLAKLATCILISHLYRLYYNFLLLLFGCSNALSLCFAAWVNRFDVSKLSVATLTT